MPFDSGVGIAKGWPMAGGQLHYQPPTLVDLLLSTTSFVSAATAGTVLATISNKTSGSTVSISPADTSGLFAIGGSGLQLLAGLNYPSVAGAGSSVSVQLMEMLTGSSTHYTNIGGHIAAASSGVQSVMPSASWNGVQNSLTTVPTASTTPHGTGLDAYKATCGITWPTKFFYHDGTDYQGLIHGGVAADPFNGRLASVTIVIEGGTPVTIQESEIIWDANFTSFGFPIKIKDNGVNGKAQGYVLATPHNGLERVWPFQIWYNNPAHANCIDQSSANAYHVDFNNADARDDGNVGHGYGTLATPFKTVDFAFQFAGTYGPGRPVMVHPDDQWFDDDAAFLGVPNPVDVTYPTRVIPYTGTTKADHMINHVGGRASNAPIHLHGEKLIIDGINWDAAQMTGITGIYSMLQIHNSNFVDASPNLNGAYETYDGFQVDSLYPVINGGMKNNFFDMNSTNGCYVGIFNSTLRMPTPTGWAEIVNVQAEGTWDLFYRQLHLGDEANWQTSFNHQAEQLGWFKPRVHVNDYWAVNAITTAYDGTYTTVSIDPASAVGEDTNYIDGTVQDIGIIYLTGHYQATYSGAAEGPTDGNFTPGLGGNNNTITWDAANSRFLVKMVGDYSSIAHGDKIKVYKMAHPDMFQIVSDSDTRTDTLRPGGLPYPTWDNFYIQNYNAKGATTQIMFPQCSNVYAASGNVTTTGTHVAFLGGAQTHLQVGQAITINQAPYDWGFVTAIASDFTSCTINRALRNGDVTNAPIITNTPMNGVLWINSQLHKTATDDDEIGQFCGAAFGWGMIGCTVLSATKPGFPPAGGNVSFVFRHQIALEGWYTSGCLFDMITNYDSDFPIPAEVMSGADNVFRFGSLPYTGSGVVQPVAVNAAGVPTATTNATVSAAFAQAAPFDGNGNARRTGDIVGRIARVGV